MEWIETSFPIMVLWLLEHLILVYICLYVHIQTSAHGTLENMDTFPYIYCTYVVCIRCAPEVWVMSVAPQRLALPRRVAPGPLLHQTQVQDMTRNSGHGPKSVATQSAQEPCQGVAKNCVVTLC